MESAMRDINAIPPPVYRPTTLVSRLILIGLLLGMLAGLTGCALVHHYDAITGKVVDLDTGEPFEGAAVHASYYTTFYNMIDPTSWYLNSQETLTDDKGEFVIPAQFAFAFRPMNLFDNYVHFIIFKPGYSCLGSLFIHPAPKILDGRLDSSQKSLVGLPRVQSFEERRQNTYCTPADGTATKSFPLLVKLLNQERSAIGIPEY
jgi:hypothetical protein